MDSKRYAKHRNKKISRKVIIGIIVAAIVVTAAAIFAVANIPKDITILDGSTSLTVTTNETDAKVIVEENGFTLGQFDVIDDSQMNKENALIIIKREMNVVFCEGKNSWKVTLPARTAGDVLAYLGKELEEGDVLEPAEFELIEEGDKITFYKAGEATLEADGTTKQIKTSNKTVKQLLEENGITLAKEDEVTPALDTVLADGETIKVTRVKYAKETEKKEIAVKTVTKKDDTLAKGTKKVLKKGSAGEEEITYKVRYEDGKAVKKEVVAKKVIKKAVNKVVAVGTYVAPTVKKNQTKTATASAGDFKYTRKYTGIASAYYEPPGSLTASGMTVGVGRIGVNPKEIPYGTKLYVTGYGYCVAADCGWGTTGMGRIADLYMNSEEECEQWGIREVTVYVLE
ncbi:MAG: G5 domain-containing protein [Clostridia bacterium]|nr:G5 domain-containing protein [Clostridia bacterium]